MSQPSDMVPDLDRTTAMKTLGNKDAAVTYVDRLAVRAIVQDPTTRQIALVHVKKGNYFKLPGGGIEADEDHSLAVAREILEETGCKISDDMGACFAKSEEWRNDLHQISFCYAAKMLENTGKPELTDLEASEGLSHSWVSVQGAFELMRAVEPTTELGRFIKERDLFFVEEFASAS